MASGDVIDFREIDLASPALLRFAEILVSEAMPAAGKETSQFTAKLVRGRAPHGPTGTLASSKGIRARRVQLKPPATVTSGAQLSKAGFYGRFQDAGWKYHPDGLHFFESAEEESDVFATAALDRQIIGAIVESGLI